MKHICMLAACLLCGCQAFAACAVRDALIREYGISHFGFEKDIPRTAEPDRKDAVLVELNDPAEQKIYDGFKHSALIDKETRQAWILRTGGIAGVHEWYGPVPLKDADLAGCEAREPDPSGRPASAPGSGD